MGKQASCYTPSIDSVSGKIQCNVLAQYRTYCTKDGELDVNGEGVLVILRHSQGVDVKPQTISVTFVFSV
jgi:hypothetical protein